MFVREPPTVKTIKKSLIDAGAKNTVSDLDNEFGKTPGLSIGIRITQVHKGCITQVAIDSETIRPKSLTTTTHNAPYACKEWSLLYRTSERGICGTRGREFCCDLTRLRRNVGGSREGGASCR